MEILEKHVNGCYALLKIRHRDRIFGIALERRSTALTYATSSDINGFFVVGNSIPDIISKIERELDEIDLWTDTVRLA